jgi:HAD superfamily hydrolase (TIGR01509 family)
MQAVIFDMDGVLIDSEIVWEQERIEYAKLRGKQWTSADSIVIMGGTSREWAAGMQRIMALEDPIETIIDEMLGRMVARYTRNLPVLPGAVAAVERMAGRYRVALASGSPRPIIDNVLRLTGLDQHFQVVVSGDEVEHGKPAPDIYLEAARQLGIAPEDCAGIEDSGNGIRALHAAGMRVIAIPQPQFMPGAEVLALAEVRLTHIEQLTFDVIEGKAAETG